MKTYPEIIQQLIDVNDKLIDGKIEIEKAKQICQNVQTLINAAKLQLEVLKYQKKSESDFFKENTTLESIDETLAEIESRRNQPYKPS
ncbi:MAG: hypothetical protein WCT77_05855 [Bacteroidota bacterium]|jgi:hypothetical protein